MKIQFWNSCTGLPDLRKPAGYFLIYSSSSRIPGAPSVLADPVRIGGRAIYPPILPFGSEGEAGKGPTRRQTVISEWIGSSTDGRPSYAQVYAPTLDPEPWIWDLR